MKLLIIFALIACATAVYTGPLLNLDKDAVRDDLVDELNSIEGTWVSHKSPHFEGIKVRDVQKMCGALKTPKDEKLPVKVFAEEDKVELPDEFDPRDQWGSECPSLNHIRDQGSCGSCWAISGASSMTHRLCIASNGTIQTPISTQEIVGCCTALHSIHCFGDMGCNGGQVGDPWKYYHASGVVSGEDYGNDQWCAPYTNKPCEHHINGTRPSCDDTPGSTPACKKSCVNGDDWDKDKHFGGSPYSMGSVDDMMQELYQHGPFEVAFTVYEDFPTYKSGVYQHKYGSALGGHAVSMNGWGVENGTKYWLVRNSWNNDWGMGGFFKILRGEDECGIEDDTAASLPKL